MDKNLEVYKFINRLSKKNFSYKEACEKYKAFVSEKGHIPITSRAKGCQKVLYGNLTVTFYKDGNMEILCASATEVITAALRNLKSILLISSLSDITYQEMLQVSTMTLPDLEDTKLSEEEYEQVRQFCLPITQLTPNYSHWSHLEKKWV